MSILDYKLLSRKNMQTIFCFALNIKKMGVSFVHNYHMYFILHFVFNFF